MYSHHALITQTVVIKFLPSSCRAGMLDVYPLQSVSSRMHAVNPGKWMMRCAMHEHYEGS